MSYDFRIAWLLPGTDVETWAHSDIPDEGRAHPGVASAHAIKHQVRDRLLGSAVQWEVFEHPGGGIEFHASGPVAGCDLLLDDYDSGLGIAYGRPAAAFDAAWAAIQICADFGATIYDGQLGRVINTETDHDLCRDSYQRTSAFVAGRMAERAGAHSEPPRLDRLSYLWRWLGLWGLVVAMVYVVAGVGFDRVSPLFAIAPFGVGWVLKMFWLDPARLRSMGWNPRITLLNLFPPYAPILQMQLFIYPPRSS